MKIEISVDNTPAYSSRVDESLFNVYVWDYGDNYHRMEGEPSSEFEQEVRRIRRRYRDLNEFNDALALYNEWIEYLASKHGGKDLLKTKIKYGLINDYVPHKPKLRDSKFLKTAYKKGIIVSSGKGYIIEDELYDYLDENYSDIDTSKTNTVFVKNKEAASIAEKELDASPTYIRSKSFKSDVDYLNEYFKLKNKRSKKSLKKKKKKHDKSSYQYRISDLMKSDYLKDFEKYQEDPEYSYGNLLLSRAGNEDVAVYHKLNDMGWNTYKIMKKANFSKRVTELFNEKKQKKKDKKRKNKKKKFDSILVDIMTDNGYDDFDAFSKDMLKMTSADLYD